MSSFYDSKNHFILIVAQETGKEVLDEARRKKKKCIIFKMDFKKACDSVCWSFLLYMLKRLGFHDKWIHWIHECLVSSSVSILFNESLSKEFMMQRGLRQGDPLTPFLYSIIAEGLSGLIREEIRKNIYRGFKVKAKEVEVNLLQYVDDTIFVGEFNMDNVVVVKSLLRCFELVSRLKVNFHKSRFRGIRVNREDIERFSSFLNCRILSFSFIYLGIPIGANLRRLEMWDPIKAKFEQKLALWKHKHLSFARNDCLINSVLVLLPKGISRKLSCIQRKFLWGYEDGREKISRVGWEKICSPKKHGGLGVKDIFV